MRNSDNFVAAHEAGHAVMSIMLDREVDYVTIERSEGSPAHCSHGGNEDKFIGTEEAILERECLIRYAGMVAEKVIMGLEYEGNILLYTYSFTDRQQATAAVQVYYGINDETEDEDYNKEIVGEYLYGIQSKADDMLSSPFVKEQLTAMANALMEHKTLTGSQVAEIMKV